MRERPILFSAPMIRALLEGRKTQTRRVVNLDKLRVRLPAEVTADPLPFHTGEPLLRARAGRHRASLNGHGAVCAELGKHRLGLKPGEFHFECPYADGDTHLGDYGGGRKVWTIAPRASALWVRETWTAERRDNMPEDQRILVAYRASCDGDSFDLVEPDGSIARARVVRWKPSIFMPREFSRITLEVTGVRVEMLQDISHEDAIAEGCAGYDWVARSPYIDGPHTDGGTLPVEEFRALWDSLNSKRAPWASNPWVWVVEFRRAETAARAA